MVLGGEKAIKTIVHIDDGPKIPLVEMQPGEEGHIEGLTGGPELAEALKTLQIKHDERVRFIRRLPPMEYVAIIANRNRIHLTEGMAAKIWGRGAGLHMQFVSAPTGEIFYIEKILGGVKARKMLNNLGIFPGEPLILEKVAHANSLRLGFRNPVVISSKEGLRLFFAPADGKRILVRKAGRSK